MGKKNIITTCVAGCAIGLLCLAGYAFFKDLDGPTVSVLPEGGRVSPRSILTVKMTDPSGIRSLVVGIRKNNALNVIFDRHFDAYLPTRTVEVPLKGAQLREGSFELEIRATDASLAGFGQGNTRTTLLPMRLDTRPPRISIQTMPPNVRRGGAGVIRYSIDEPVLRSGVMIRDYFVPGYLQNDGSYLCFFPFPYGMSAPEFKKAIEITATDLAGNETKSHLNVFAYERTFRNDKIELSDDFLGKVAAKLGHLAPDAKDDMECYLYINNQVRAANVQMLRNLRDDTAAAMLWSGPFLRLPRAAPRAGFADHRFMTYKGKNVGESWHLGFDLASLRQADVPAGNSGRVIFTGDAGIYGNLIVIDHGLGLMSLYSHLTRINVRAGDVVARGQIIAKTGETGLAFGDHLHFGILVGGVEVTPLEWFDAKWIKDNITGRIGLGGGA